MLLITQPEFFSTTWQSAFPEITLQKISTLPADLHNHEVIWIVSQIPNWTGLVKQASNAGKSVIVLSKHASSSEFKEAFSHGARGYLDALSNPQILNTAYIGVKSGALWIPEDLVNQMVGNIHQLITSDSPPNLTQLTDAEKRVAEKISHGESNKEAAEELHVSERTIKSHLTSIYNKLNIRDRMQLMLFMRGKSKE